MVAVQFHTDDLLTTPREHFQRNAACAGKEVQGTDILEVDIAVEYVEDVLFGEVGRGTCLEGARYVEVTAFVLSGDDTHGSVERLFFCEERYQIERHALDERDGGAVELCRGVENIDLLDEAV